MKTYYTSKISLFFYARKKGKFTYTAAIVGQKKKQFKNQHNMAICKSPVF